MSYKYKNPENPIWDSPPSIDNLTLRDKWDSFYRIWRIAIKANSSLVLDEERDEFGEEDPLISQRDHRIHQAMYNFKVFCTGSEILEDWYWVCCCGDVQGRARKEASFGTCNDLEYEAYRLRKQIQYFEYLNAPRVILDRWYERARRFTRLYKERQKQKAQRKPFDDIHYL